MFYLCHKIIQPTSPLYFTIIDHLWQSFSQSIKISGMVKVSTDCHIKLLLRDLLCMTTVGGVFPMILRSISRPRLISMHSSCLSELALWNSKVDTCMRCHFKAKSHSSSHKVTLVDDSSCGQAIWLCMVSKSPVLKKPRTSEAYAEPVNEPCSSTTQRRQ